MGQIVCVKSELLLEAAISMHEQCFLQTQAIEAVIIIVRGS